MQIPRFLALLAFACLAVTTLRAHGGVELGPNGGRLVEFGEKNPLHAEVVLKDGNFVIGLYDEEAKKEVALAEQELVVTERNSGKKLTVEKKDGKWVLAKPAAKDFWLILQLRDKPGAKARTGRLHYDETNCSECNNPEWICKCEELKRAKKDKK